MVKPKLLARVWEAVRVRFPFFDLEPAEETIEQWHREGLPAGKSVAEFFNFEAHHSVGLVIRSYPCFEKAPDKIKGHIFRFIQYTPF